MSELVVTLLRVGYLVVLWLFVLGVVAVLRHDIFGTRVTARGKGRPGPRERRRGAPAAGRAARGAPARGAATRLVITDGPLAGTTLPLSGAQVLVGRSPGNTLVLDDDYASNRHARFFPKDGGWWLEDLGSTNGTYADGERVSAAEEIRPGVPVRIGQTVLELRR